MASMLQQKLDEERKRLEQAQTFAVPVEEKFTGFDIVPLEEEFSSFDSVPLEFDRDVAINALEQELMADAQQRDIDRMFGELTREEVMPGAVPEELLEKEKMFSNIDFDFLGAQEGFETKGYIPKSKGKVLDGSGVTVGTGVDLGQWSEKQFRNFGIEEDTLTKLRPYFGLTTDKAEEKLKSNPLNLTTEEALNLSNKVKENYVEGLIKRFNEDSDVPFEELPTEIATPILSVYYQLGYEGAPNFWDQVTSGDFNAAYNNLLDFGTPKYEERRLREAGLFKEGLDTLASK